MPAVMIKDETLAGEVRHTFTLQDLDEQTTVREIIRARVYQEVQDYDLKAKNGELFKGLVTPREEEKRLNGKESQQRKLSKIDWLEQYEKAVESFEKNGFFILIDDCQADSLEQQVTVSVDSRISFVKLVPLVGG